MPTIGLLPDLDACHALILRRQLPDRLFAMRHDILCNFGILLVRQQLGDRILEHPACELAAADSHAHRSVFDIFLQESCPLSLETKNALQSSLKGALLDVFRFQTKGYFLFFWDDCGLVGMDSSFLTRLSSSFSRKRRWVSERFKFG